MFTSQAALVCIIVQIFAFQVSLEKVCILWWQLIHYLSLLTYTQWDYYICGILGDVLGGSGGVVYKGKQYLRRQGKSGKCDNFFLSPSRRKHRHNSRCQSTASRQEMKMLFNNTEEYFWIQRRTMYSPQTRKFFALHDYILLCGGLDDMLTDFVFTTRLLFLFDIVKWFSVQLGIPNRCTLLRTAVWKFHDFSITQILR